MLPAQPSPPRARVASSFAGKRSLKSKPAASPSPAAKKRTTSKSPAKEAAVKPTPEPAAQAAAPVAKAAPANHDAVTALLIAIVMGYLGATYMKADLHFMTNTTWRFLKVAPVALMAFQMHESASR